MFEMDRAAMITRLLRRSRAGDKAESSFVECGGPSAPRPRREAPELAAEGLPLCLHPDILP